MNYFKSLKIDNYKLEKGTVHKQMVMSSSFSIIFFSFSFFSYLYLDAFVQP